MPITEGRPAGIWRYSGHGPVAGELWCARALKQLHPNLKVVDLRRRMEPTHLQSALRPRSQHGASTPGICQFVRHTFIQEISPRVFLPALSSMASTSTGSFRTQRYGQLHSIDDRVPQRTDTLSATTGKTYLVLADLAAGPSTPGAAVDSGNEGL